MKRIILATAALIAMPAMAQSTTTSTAPAQPATPAMAVQKGMGSGMGRHMRHGPMFPSMSEAGRKQMMEAMRSAPEDRDAIKAARDKVAAVIGADKLDVNALKRAMDDERRLVDTQHSRHQATMLATIQKLSAEDRKAFAQDVAKARDNMKARAEQWRARRAAPAPAATPR